MSYKEIRNYETALRFLNGKMSKRILKNVLIVNRITHIGIFYFHTEIVCFMPDNKVKIYANGFLTKTTKRYINLFAGNFVNLWQEKFRWYFLPKQYPSVIREFQAYGVYVI